MSPFGDRCLCFTRCGPVGTYKSQSCGNYGIYSHNNDSHSFMSFVEAIFSNLKYVRMCTCVYTCTCVFLSYISNQANLSHVVMHMCGKFWVLLFTDRSVFVAMRDTDCVLEFLCH